MPTKKTTKKSAKKATKKRAAKKVGKKAAKKVGKKAAKKTVGTSIQDPEKLPQLVFKSKIKDKDRSKVFNKMTVNVRKSIDLLKDRSKTKPLRLLTPAGLRRMLVEAPELHWQYALSSIGFRTPGAWEIIAPDGIGKTTLCYWLIGKLALEGCYTAHIECEGKPMSATRIMQILHPNKKTAKELLNTIMLAEARQLLEADDVIQKVIKDLRARCDADPETKGNPIFVFVDPWSGLKSTAEAKGRSDYGMAKNAKKETPADTVTNFGHSKHAQVMKRWLPEFLENYNATIAFVNHQNEKLDMRKRKMPSFMEPSESKNDTRIGGRALRQLCPYRMTLMPLGDAREKKGAKRVYGHHVKLMVVKNSYGPRYRTCEFTIYTDLFQDTAETQSPRLSFQERTPAWMVKEGLLGTTVTDNRYTCDALGCVGVSDAELYEALENHPEHKAYIGASLGIEGYQSAVLAIDPAEDLEEAHEGELPPVVPLLSEEDAPPIVPPIPGADEAPPTVPALPPIAGEADVDMTPEQPTQQEDGEKTESN